MTKNRILGYNQLDIERLQELQQKPLPFTPGEPSFWNDPYISQQMLKAHLDPATDAASRRPETIDRSVAWIVRELDLHGEASILDLGCGPGLYTARLAGMGFRVTGVDYSQRSIEYARQYALDHNLKIHYRYQDYLTLEDESQYDAALLIYGDFCPLSPDQRSKLLANIHRALKSRGALVLDVSRHTPADPIHPGLSWYATAGGFWRPGPHLVLENTFSYPDLALQMDQYIVIEAAGDMAVYRTWRQEYTRESIAAELQAGSFSVQGFWGDLTGTPYTEDGEWIGIIARKR